MTRIQDSAAQRVDAHANRTRILAAARQGLRDDPDASLDSIARAAGLATRTLYGHFANRQALVSAVTREAGQAIVQVSEAAGVTGLDPLETAARMGLAAWAVQDEYRMLISLGRRAPGRRMIHATLAPVRQQAITTLRCGQHRGVFTDHVPAPVLARTLEAMMLALAEENAASTWADPTGEAAVAALLVAAGVAPQAAALRVRHVRRDLAQPWGRRRSSSHLADRSVGNLG
jgi:AcrR family transcriptional regulator